MYGFSPVKPSTPLSTLPTFPEVKSSHCRAISLQSIRRALLVTARDGRVKARRKSDRSIVNSRHRDSRTVNPEAESPFNGNEERIVESQMTNLRASPSRAKRHAYADKRRAKYKFVEQEKHARKVHTRISLASILLSFSALDAAK